MLGVKILAVVAFVVASWVILIAVGVAVAG